VCVCVCVCVCVLFLYGLWGNTDYCCVFRTVALSEHFSSYNLGNDPAFLAKVTKTMFGHYLATYIV